VNINKIIISMLAILILTSTALADNAGVTGNAFLRIGMGARAAGMGGAFCAIADDASSNYYNPAGLCGIEKQELLFMHTEWLADIASEYLAYALPMDEDKSLGASLIFLHTEDMARNRATQETGKFNNHDACLSLSYASKRGRVAWGLTPKIIQRQLKDETAASVGLDIGSKYTNNNLSLGVTIQNIGNKIKFISESSSSPLSFKLGIGYKMLTENDSLTIAGDIDKSIDNDPFLMLGAEYNYANLYQARVGARIGQAKQGLSSGLGIVFRDWRFDYAFTSFDDLGLTHRAAITRYFEVQKRITASHRDTENAEWEKKVVEEKPAMAVSDKSEVTPAMITPSEPEPFQPCCVFVFPDTRIFTPNGDGTLNSVSFILRAMIQAQVTGWELRIVDKNNKMINVFAENGTRLPEIFIWDGRNKSGNISSQGSYFCICSITDKNGKVWTSGKEIIVIE